MRERARGNRGSLTRVRAPIRLFFAAILVVLAVFPGCTCNKAGGDRTKVAVSIFPIYDLVRRVAGPDADVTLLLPPGQTEHTFNPTSKEIEDAARSKLGVMVGLGLDPWMEKLMNGVPTARVLKVGDRVPTLAVKDDPVGDEEADKARKEKEAHDEHEHEKGAIDPHVWLDPRNAVLMTKAIGEELARVDGKHAQGYRDRANALVKVLEDLDKEVDTQVKTWKLKQFVTFHGSFQYFAARYGLEIVAVIEPFPGSTPTGEYLETVLKVVKEKKVPALFSEPQLDPKPAQVIASDAKIPLGTLDPVGGSPETDSYEKLIRFDVAALEKVLK
jgi:zinc transport system substrate-binding protein